MEIINHECYISLEVAKLLKKLGFNWEVKTYYHYLSPYDEYNLEFDSISTNYNHLNNADFSAPTFAVVQRWLREVKKYNLIVNTSINEDDPEIIDYEYFILTNDKTPIYNTNLYFDTYEEALEVGIKKTLEIILERGE